MMSEERDKLHSVESAAQFLGGISPWTIRMWLHLGKLRRIKVGRRTFVYESDLTALIQPQEVDPASSSARQKGADPRSPPPTRRT